MVFGGKMMLLHLVDPNTLITRSNMAMLRLDWVISVDCMGLEDVITSGRSEYHEHGYATTRLGD
jgi:hypothetical protein